MASSSAPASPSGGLARRWTYGVLLLSFLFVLMPFLFWQSTWFGRPLTDQEIGKNLADLEHPRKTQHALSQIADRIIRRDTGVKRWYPQVAALAGHRVDEIRVTAAWVMGQDNEVPEFHLALARLLRDPQPMVRRNAALSLVRFQDAAGRTELLGMLRPYALAAPQAGVLAQRLKIGDAVNPGTLLARIRVGQQEIEVRSPVPGSLVRWVAGDAAQVSPGDELVLIAPSAEMVWEALRALVLVGTPEDLPEIERFASGVKDMPPAIAQQAQLTVRAIRQRM